MTISRIVGRGAEGQPTVEARRIRTINTVAWVASICNVLYIVGFLLTDPNGLSLVIATNAISIGLAMITVFLNGRGSTNAAMWLLMLTGLFNLTSASLLLGLGSGVHFFLIVLPVMAVLITPEGDRSTQIVFISLCALAFVGVVLAAPTSPPAVATTPLGDWLLITSLFGTAVFAGVFPLYFRHLADTAEAELFVANQRSEVLLLNILPQPIAERLKAGEEVIADRVEAVTVLIADLVGSTPLSERLSPRAMVELLDSLFTPFDDLADELGLEKIKTIGDAYMVVGGLPTPRPDHLQAIAEMALAINRFLVGRHVEGHGQLEMRIGISTGPVMAGVIGKRKFSYDLWGDTVNTASRMESHGVPGRIQVTEEVQAGLADSYHFEDRGPIEVKGKGVMNPYFLIAARS